MHCQLLVPALPWPEPAFRDIVLGMKLPALEQFLAKGRRRHTDARSAEAWLCEQFGVDRQGAEGEQCEQCQGDPQGNWPVAPFSLLADGGEPAAHYWLRADPVHFKLDGNRLVLADSGMFSLSYEEAESLSRSLNAHFSAEGFSFYPLRPERWYLRAERAPALQTTPLSEAIGRNVDNLLPRGADGAAWRARLNEIQMLLHGHEINRLREEAGLLPINGVWPWGGGMLQDALSAPMHAVWCRDALALGLARAAHVTAHDLPAGAADLLRASGSEGVNLIVLDGLRQAAQYGDAGGWREGLERLERDWFAPLLEALTSGRIGMLSLHALGPGAVLSAELARGDLRRFWRRVKPLATVAWQ